MMQTAQARTGKHRCFRTRLFYRNFIRSVQRSRVVWRGEDRGGGVRVREWLNTPKRAGQRAGYGRIRYDRIQPTPRESSHQLQVPGLRFVLV